MLPFVGWSFWSGSTWLALLVAVEWGIRLVMVPVILRRRFQPSTALAWLTIIFLLPEVGFVIYLLIGSNRLGRRRVRKHRRVVDMIRSEHWRTLQRRYAAMPVLNATQQSMMLQAEQSTGLPIVTGNQVELMPNNATLVERLINDIDTARHHVHLTFYIWDNDETGARFADALARASGRGIQCRVLVDAVGSRPFFKRGGLAEAMRGRGVQVVASLPVAPLRRRLARLDLRNHRKLAVIDGRLAYTGSQNIHNPNAGHWWAGTWIDMTARCRGPIVQQLQTVFVEDWAFETEVDLEGEDIFPQPELVGDIAAQAVPTGPSHESQHFHRILITAIHAARRKIIITTPYLVPDEATMLALAMATDRGVEVNLVVPERSDMMIVSAAGRSYYDWLLDNGVRLYHHRRGFLHAKTMTVDDAFALLGSANIDIRSFELNFELSVLLYGSEVTQKLRFAQTQIISESEQLSLKSWQRRPILKRYADAAAALLSPLL